MVTTLSGFKKAISDEEMKQAKAEYDYKMNLIAAELKMKKEFYDKWKELVEQEAKGNPLIFEKELQKLLGITSKELGLQRNKIIEERDKVSGEKGDEQDKKDREKTLAGFAATEKGKQEIQAASIEAMNIASDAAFEIGKNRLQRQKEAELSNKNLTEKQKLEINRKYYKQEQGMAVTQAIINGILAIAKTFATLGWPAGIAGAAIQAAATIAQIAVIKSQSYDGGGSGGSNTMPTAISSSAPTQKAVAPTVGSTILMQPQLSQTQLNAMPNQNLLTADDIAKALMKMPAPRVSVEDINNRSNEVRKVEVRANI